MRKRILVAIFISLIFIISGCTSEVPVSQVSPDFDAEKDLSLYIVEAPEPAEPKIAPEDPSLEYVDTHYISILMDKVMPTSKTRKSYDDVMPEWDFVLIDSRPKGKFSQGHINGSINIPDADFAKKSSLLPKDKDTELIFYCNGLECSLSAKSAKKAVELGYTNVKVYQPGAPGWKDAGNYLVVTEGYVQDLIMETYMSRTDLPPYFIYDARPYSLYFKSHIPNAISMDSSQYNVRYTPSLPSDKDALVITYCNGFECGKSHTLADKLVEDGYSNVYVLSGGIPSWQKANLPTFGMKGATRNFDVAAGKVNRAIKGDAFKAKLAANAFVIDVRSEAEYASGNLEVSINIPDGVISADPKAILDQLPEDKNTTILLHCASGARSAGVVDKIADLGYKNTYYLDAKINISEDGSYSIN